jgi:hypothetical protein
MFLNPWFFGALVTCVLFWLVVFILVWAIVR